MPKIIDHDQYRKVLLAKCFDLFADKGYGHISMRELAKELGVSTGTLYHYWKGKQEIFDDLFALRTEQDRKNFIKVTGNAGQDLAKNISKRIELLFEFAKANEDYFRKQFFISLDYYRQQESKEEMFKNPVVKSSNDKMRETLSTFIGTDDREIITMLMNVLAGILMGRIFEGELVSFKRQAKLLGRMLQLHLEAG